MNGKMIFGFLLLCGALNLNAALRFDEVKAVTGDSSDPVVKLAVEELQRFRKLAGLPPLAVTADASGVPAIVFTRGEPENPGRDSFDLKLNGKQVEITGDHAGKLYAVYELMRRFGWRYYAPGCETPPAAGKPVEDFQVSRTPFMELRQPEFGYGENTAYCGKFPLLRLGYSPQQRLLNMPGTLLDVYPVTGVHESYHTEIFIVPDDKALIQKMPEMYARDRQGRVIALQEGKAGGGCHACIADPAFRERALKMVLDWIEHSPGSLAVCIGQADNTNWCECPECLKLDPVPQPEGQMKHHMVDRQLNLVNWIAREVAKQYPKMKVVLLVYSGSGTFEPPVKAGMEPNVIPMLCPYVPEVKCFNRGFDCPENREFRDLFLEWRKKFPRREFYLFDYPVNYSNRYTVFFPLDGFIERMRFCKAQNVRGITLCDVPRMFTGLFLFLEGKQMWNPDLTDAELRDLENEFIQAYYGPAAPDIAAYLALVRKASAKCCQGIYSPKNEPCDETFIRESLELLDRAEQAAGSQQPYLDRVRREKGIILLTDLACWSVRDDAHRLKRLREFRDICKALKVEMRPSNTDNVAQWLNQAFHLPTRATDEFHGVDDWYRNPALAVLDSCRSDADFARLAETLKQSDPASVVQTEDREKITVPEEGLHSRTGHRIVLLGEPTMVLYGGDTLNALVRYDSPRPYPGGKLTVYALDRDKNTGKTAITVKLNGNVLFSGSNQASKEKITALSFPVPEGAVKTGINTVEICDDSPVVPESNWIAVSKLELSPSNSPWKTIAQNIKFSVWSCELQQRTTYAKDGAVTVKLLRNATQPSFLQLFAICPEGLIKPDKRYRITASFRANPPAMVGMIVLEHSGVGRVATKWLQIPVSAKWGKTEVVFSGQKDFKGYRLFQMNIGTLPNGTEFQAGTVKLEEME